MAASSSSPLPLAPPPWTCKCTVYILPFYKFPSSGLPLGIAYDRLEAEAPSFTSEEHAGKYNGGLCMAQIIRYSETPVGPYDELALLPGYFKGVESAGGKRKDLRITGIWVSQEASLINGRRNWNIPKHLAHFAFTPCGAASTALKVEVFSCENPSTHPFFSATIQPLKYSPSFPFSSNWVGFLGMSTHISQPPLPVGEPADVVIGTDSWKRSNPTIKCTGAKMVWIDMKQPGGVKKSTGPGRGENDALLDKDHENWWPGMRRWHIGLFCPDATLELGEPEIITI